MISCYYNFMPLQIAMAAHHGEGHRPWYRSCRQKGIPVPVHMPIVEVGSIPSETGKSPRKAGEDSTMAGASWGLSDCTDRQFFKRFNWRQMSDFHSLHLQNLQKNGVGSTFQSSSGWDVRSSLAPIGPITTAPNHSLGTLSLSGMPMKRCRKMRKRVLLSRIAEYMGRRTWKNTLMVICLRA